MLPEWLLVGMIPWAVKQKPIITDFDGEGRVKGALYTIKYRASHKLYEVLASTISPSLSFD